MTTLSIYSVTPGEKLETLTDHAAIAARLAALGVEFEHWPANAPLAVDAGQEQVLAAYRDEVEHLNARYGFKSIDVVNLSPDHPQKAEMRQKFLAEHTHDDFEVRFFVQGRGLFYLHIGERVYFVLCEQGDLLSVPGHITHWFDMGTHPNFRCIRFFTEPDGWVGKFTGSDIAQRFPNFDDFTAARP
jgi:1,2-dihydroxy-3-keto-5-methylthiopentene dioxygenase